METTEMEPEKTATDQSGQITIESIENYFIGQGNLIEAQITAENVYPSCPVCSKGQRALITLRDALRDSLQTVDKMQACTDQTPKSPEEILAFLKRDLGWYEIAKMNLGNMLQAGHHTRDIMSAHPELAVSKAQKRKIRSGKHLKQLAKRSRQKNRH
jgi:hypothetical protein